MCVCVYEHELDRHYYVYTLYVKFFISYFLLVCQSEIRCILKGIAAGNQKQKHLHAHGRCPAFVCKKKEEIGRPETEWIVEK